MLRLFFMIFLSLPSCLPSSHHQTPQTPQQTTLYFHLQIGDHPDSDQILKNFHSSEIIFVASATDRYLIKKTSIETATNLTKLKGNRLPKAGKISEEDIRSLEASDISQSSNKDKIIPAEAHVHEGTTVFRGMALDTKSLEKIAAHGIEAPIFYNQAELNPSQKVQSSIKAHQTNYNSSSKLKRFLLGFQQGLAAKASLFVSTSQSLYVARNFSLPENATNPNAPRLDSFVFKIKTPAHKAIDVNKARAKKSKYDNELEVVIIGRIPPENIDGFYDLQRKLYVCVSCDKKAENLMDFTATDFSSWQRFVRDQEQ